jgi:hypothetical protein
VEERGPATGLPAFDTTREADRGVCVYTRGRWLLCPMLLPGRWKQWTSGG